MKRLAASGCAFAIWLAFGASAWAADVANGKFIFEKTCANCHSIDAGVNKVGPTLFDVVDRPIASIHDYDYSKKMRAVGKQWKVWDEKNLNTYLTNPRQVLHGVKMFFAVPDAKDRTDVIAYLTSIK